MVRNYKKKTNRVNIDEIAMKNAIREVLRNKISERGAAINFRVKRGTLHSRIQKIKKYSHEELCKLYGKENSGSESNVEDTLSKYTVHQVFTTEQEHELVQYIKTCSDINYGLTYRQIRVIAYQYGSVLPNCKVPNRWKVNQKAGIDWLKCFMRRNKSKISLRKPENTSLARATGFNKNSVSEFFEKLYICD